MRVGLLSENLAQGAVGSVEPRLFTFDITEPVALRLYLPDKNGC